MAADSVPLTSSTNAADPSYVTSSRRTTAATGQINLLLNLEIMATTTAATPLSTMNAVAALTSITPRSSDRPTTCQSSNHRVVDINYHQDQQNRGGGDSSEHLRLGGGGRRGGRPMPGRGYGSGHRGGYGFHRHRRDGWRGHHGFAFPLPQQNIMPLIPFSVPPHMEQPEAPLTAEEREKKIREQIEYYFSENNLCSDVYLKGWMNQQGWVPLTLVAGFPRVQALTTDYETVQRSVLSSTEVELQT
uniref:HTH La-type RNA-binding domain-containing protein n=1 Tax=Oryza barthii TaxID=65489 RepID=A0A0D3HE26_9ORYZ